MNKANARSLLRQFNFKDLFLNELGWDDHHGTLPLKVYEDTVILIAVAEKRGMAAYLCTMPGPGKSYDYQTRCRIEIQLAKSVQEHLVIYMDSDRHFQIWQWVKRESGRPIARREHTYTVGQSGESLLQKLEALEIKIEEDEQLTLVGITGKVKGAFDIDRVTKRFYETFKSEHAAFLKLIEGIDDEHDREWYASIMLNRLKFVYFIQKKGFLDRDKDYLRNRLAMVKKTHPKTKFLSFYRAFLIKLFHDGLGNKERLPELRQLLGTIPYLNGGIFAVHPLEEKHSEIDIPDKAFEKVFTFFDQYRWHLDERPLRADDEINPDVLGYIFEKYINQKQMGAYYTKEDITEYIAKNCIIPFIFDRVESEMKKIGKNQEFHNLFKLLANDPDRYIYDPVKHGVALPLPKEIEDGVDTTKPNLIERRSGWNRPAPSEYALPTETWREVLARRQRYAEIHATLTVRHAALGINDLITLNLNIRQFAQDCIENAESPDLLWAFWKTIEEISVLDPTGGSGAFLFAALNVLEPLYESCLDRMKAFMLEWSQAKKVPYPNFYEKFASVIARVEKHANEKYFIYKSIIIRNLYGVDIMDEAVEICKLRLFLKLAAQIEPDYDKDNLGIEPLPDIDFNIRAGNTLVGFATEKQAKDVIQQDLLAYNTVWPEVQRDAKEIAELFGRFRQKQTEICDNGTTEDKDRLREKLALLEARLNCYLAESYGVAHAKQNALKEWVTSHKPFHWFIEFYEIMKNGGFDVIIGNPPYVEYQKKNSAYRLDTHKYETLETGNLYPLVVERSSTIVSQKGILGMIVPLSAFCTQRMTPLVQMVHKMSGTKWVAHFGWRPATLFSGVNIPLSILLHLPGQEKGLYTTTFNKWYREQRDFLFPCISYVSASDFICHDHVIPKIGSQIEQSILRKAFAQKKTVQSFLSTGRDQSSTLYYRNTGGLYWRIITDFQPFFELNGQRASSSTESTLQMRDRRILNYVTALLNSNFFWFHYVIYSSFHHVNPIDILSVPFDADRMKSKVAESLENASASVMQDLKQHSQIRLREHKGGNRSRAQTFFPSRSKTYVDQIDCILADHYGFSPEELDYIINFDVKYRQGTDEEDSE
jgi:hypothetical protein